MFRIILLIFISIYFLWSFVSQILTSYIPFKQSQTINIYEFLENAIYKANIELENNNTNWKIDVDYQWQILENINYYSTWITNFWTNSWTISTVNWIVIEAPWKINSKQGQKLEIFVPIIEEDGQLLYTKSHNTVDWRNLDSMYLKIWSHEYFDDLWTIPFSNELNWQYIMYRQILAEFEPSIFSDSSITVDWTSTNYIDEIFEQFDIEFKQQKILDKKSIIYFWKSYDDDLKNNTNCILVWENLQTQIDNAWEWDELVLCKWTFEISNRLNIDNKKDLTITSITKNPEDTIIKNTSWFTNWKWRIFAVQDWSDNLKIEWITFDYPWDNWIKFNNDIDNLELLNNILIWKTPINSNNISMDNAIIKWNYINSTDSEWIVINEWNNIQIINNKIEIDDDNKYAIDINSMDSSDSIIIKNNDFINVIDDEILRWNDPTITFEWNYFDQDPDNSTWCNPNFSDDAPSDYTNTNCKSYPQFIKPITKNNSILEKSLLLWNLYIYKLNLESYIADLPSTDWCNIIKDSSDPNWEWRLKKIIYDNSDPFKQSFTWIENWSDMITTNNYLYDWICGNPIAEERTKYFLR